MSAVRCPLASWKLPHFLQRTVWKTLSICLLITQRYKYKNYFDTTNSTHKVLYAKFSIICLLSNFFWRKCLNRGWWCLTAMFSRDFVAEEGLKESFSNIIGQKRFQPKAGQKHGGTLLWKSCTQSSEPFSPTWPLWHRCVMWLKALCKILRKWISRDNT